MGNLLDHFFNEAVKRIPSPSALSDQDLPQPEYPEQREHESLKVFEDADLFTVDNIRLRDRVAQRLSGRAWEENRLPLSDDDRRLLDGGIREGGIDVYAFYKSRRHINANPFPGKWGIFYLEHGVERIRELIEQYNPGFGDPFWLAYEFLREHEYFHFKFDLYALSIESTIGRSLYDPLKRTFRNHLIYQVEEALANRAAWDWAKKPKVGIRELAFDIMKLQPGAYARFDERKQNLASELASNLLDLNISSSARRDDQSLFVGNVPKELLRRSLCPEYFVRPTVLGSWISFSWKLPKILDIKEAQSFANLLNSKHQNLRNLWQETKKKLLQDPSLPGLNFKRWPKEPGYWSVRINSNFRAHLRPLTGTSGVWEAAKFGTHNTMGHG